MARKKAPSAEPPKAEGKESKTDGNQTELAGTNDERPAAVAGVRFSLAEAKATLKRLQVKGKLQDEHGDLLKIAASIHVELGPEEIDLLPEVAPVVGALVELGQKLPGKVKNQFALSVGRDFAGALFTLRGKPGPVAFNATVEGAPAVRVVKGAASLVLKLEGVVRDGDFKALCKYLNDRPTLTVEPPQQELDFPEAA